MQNKIYALIQKYGPLLPVEVAGKSNIDSFLAKAYLSDMVEQGKLKTSLQKVGTSYIYYIPGQEEAVKQRLSQISNQPKTAKTYGRPPTNISPELAKKRAAFAERATKVLKEEKKLNQKPLPKQIYKSVPTHPTQSIPAQITRPSPKPVEVIVKSTPVKDIDFLDHAMDYLIKQGVEITEELSRKKNQVELIVNAPSNLGKLSIYVKIKKKRSINDADLSIVYANAIDKKLPAILITNGKLTKSAHEFLERKKDVLKVKQL